MHCSLIREQVLRAVPSAACLLIMRHAFLSCHSMRRFVNRLRRRPLLPKAACMRALEKHAKAGLFSFITVF